MCLFFVSICPASSSTEPFSKPLQQAVASAHPLATQAGLDILNQGGNAFDAAVAVSAALAVVEPFGSGIGGGGFWLLHRASDGKQVMLDGREVAPENAHRDMYLDAQGNVIKGLSVNGALSAGIPGMPAAIDHLSKHYGALPLAMSLAPAIKYAESGFQVGAHYHRLVTFRRETLLGFNDSKNIFLSDGNVPAVGDNILQKDLANTLSRLAEDGFDGFYTGDVANRLVKGVTEAGGIWTLQDLANYQVVERKPTISAYKEMNIISAAPPSSGGIVLAIALNILNDIDLNEYDRATQIHIIVEVMRRAYRDRALYLGDEDFVEFPKQRLMSKQYADDLAASLDISKASDSKALSGIKQVEGHDTTHFSVLDKNGNRVSATLSINYPFGSGFVVPGTGVLLNDEMDDFSIKPGVPNVYGLVGGKANEIQPRKRMLSSMSPTFIETENSIGILGTPGGSRIISMVMLAILEVAQGRGVDAWVSAPRFHHQYVPNHIQYEEGALTESLLEALHNKGHKTKAVGRSYGNMHAILWDKKVNKVTAASDPRGEGRATVE
jgi:gamma-glutamyltranspeptidase/glutathione hydrolase